MANITEVQSLGKISSEVGESQIVVTLATQCIKAQAFLADKLKKQAERNKETCSYISIANMKLQSEIEQAQQEISSMLTAQETIVMANVELTKELLLAKNKRQEVIERVNNGVKKYENLWADSRKRYESLHFVQKLLDAEEKLATLSQQDKKVEDEENALKNKIKAKKAMCLELDRKRVIELAEFIICEMPKSIEIIKEKTMAIDKLGDELKNLGVKIYADVKANTPVSSEKNKDKVCSSEDWPLDKHTHSGISIFPKLKLTSMDIDIFSDKLDQIQIKRTDSLSKCLKPKGCSDSFMDGHVDSNLNVDKTSGFMTSPFFNNTKAFNDHDDREKQDFSKKRLINILEDIKIDKNDALNLMAEVNPESLQPVDMITVEGDCLQETALEDKSQKIVYDEQMKIIDPTSSDVTNILNPPTQFLDLTPTEEKKQEDSMTKKVSFDVPSDMDVDKNPGVVEDNDPNETRDSHLDVSAVSEEGFSMIKDMIMKKHNLDSSPQFSYAKKIITPLGGVDRHVTSKFFHDNQVTENIARDKKSTEEAASQIQVSPNDNTDKNGSLKIVELNTIKDSNIECSPKPQKTYELMESDKPIAGLLFTHGVQALPESLNASTISTTGFDDGDNDFPHYLDSSLLMSPKADVQIPMSNDNPEVLSQDVPNFLTGFRRTALSFFGQSESQADSSATNQGGSGFSFNFGSKEKKNRVGLFNMFQ